MLVFIHCGECQSRSSSSYPSSTKISIVVFPREWSSTLSISRKRNRCIVMEWHHWSNPPAVNDGNSLTFLQFIPIFFPRQRLPTRNVFYYRCPDHRKNYVMSFTFCFDREDDVYQFAYSFPYSYTKLQNYLENIEQRQLDYVQRRPLIYSVVNRTLSCFSPHRRFVCA